VTEPSVQGLFIVQYNFPANGDDDENRKRGNRTVGTEVLRTLRRIVAAAEGHGKSALRGVHNGDFGLSIVCAENQQAAMGKKWEAGN
jgi:hypothetical protein